MSTEFILLGVQRSGTTFLSSCLNSHPDIYIYPELFLDSAYTRSDNFYRFWIDAIKEDESAIMRSALPGLVQKFLDKSYHAFTDKKAVGINVKYDELGFVEPLAKIISSRRPSIIHLVRKNILKTYISSVLNWQQEQLGRKSHGTAKVPPVKVPIYPNSSLLRELERRQAEIEVHRRALASYAPHLELTYEDLVENDEASSISSTWSKRMLEFLTVQDSDVLLGTELRKTNPPRLRDLVENFDTLQMFLATTKWAYLVEGE